MRHHDERASAAQQAGALRGRNEHPVQRTVVRWELASSKGGTLLRVTHSGLADLPVSRKDYSGGWPGVVEQIKKFIEG